MDKPNPINLKSSVNLGKQDIDKLLGELTRAPLELFLEDGAVDLMRRAANVLRNLIEAGATPTIIVKPLEWRDQGYGDFVAAAPLLGNIRVEHSGKDFCVSYSIPGFSAPFVNGDFPSPEEAKKAAETEYQRRMQLALAVSDTPR